jgi:hypothetical protein
VRAISPPEPSGARRIAVPCAAVLALTFVAAAADRYAHRARAALLVTDCSAAAGRSASAQARPSRACRRSAFLRNHSRRYSCRWCASSLRSLVALVGEEAVEAAAGDGIARGQRPGAGFRPFQTFCPRSCGAGPPPPRSCQGARRLASSRRSRRRGGLGAVNAVEPGTLRTGLGSSRAKASGSLRTRMFC